MSIYVNFETQYASAKYKSACIPNTDLKYKYQSRKKFRKDYTTSLSLQADKNFVPRLFTLYISNSSATVWNIFSKEVHMKHLNSTQNTGETRLMMKFFPVNLQNFVEF